MSSIDASELFIIGFEKPKLNTEQLQFLKSRPLGGLILFRRNIVDLAQVIELNSSIIQTNPQHVPLLSVDQEGGRVARLRGLCTDIPPLKELLPLFNKDPYLAFRLGAMMGRELVALGFNLNFAPVCDVGSNQENNDIIGDRSFSDDPQAAAPLCANFIKGMQGAGLAACAKHFPGHGSTIIDSHFSLPRINLSLKHWEQTELLPFKSAINSQVATIMTAHIIYEEIDKKVPATMSEKIIQQILREENNYSGVVISDDLDMKAVADNYDLEQIIEQSLMASVDMFIIGNNWPKAMEAIELTNKLINKSSQIKAQAQKAINRINILRNKYLGKATVPSLEYAQVLLRCAPHVELLKNT